jgi:hypothetical protein
MSERVVPWPATMGCTETEKWQPQIDAWPCAWCGERRDAHVDVEIPIADGIHHIVTHCRSDRFMYYRPAS